jgi:hypothetical protein
MINRVKGQVRGWGNATITINALSVHTFSNNLIDYLFLKNVKNATNT